MGSSDFILGTILFGVISTFIQTSMGGGHVVTPAEMINDVITALF